MIIVPHGILGDMIEHARVQAPEEACGLLVGVGMQVMRSYRLANVDASPEHFSLDPREQFAVVKDIRPEGWEILAVYHSHPASPARMSQEDLHLAFAPEMRYVIVSLMDSGNPQIGCFTVSQGQPVEEPVLTEELQ